MWVARFILELNRIAAEVGSRQKAFQLAKRDHKLVRFFLPLEPADPERPVWAVIRDQCEKHDVAFFFKQWGGRNKKAAGRELEGTLHDTFPKAKKRRVAKIS